MLRRSLRARVRVGAAARRRIQRGGPRATGRPAASLEEWAAIRGLVFRRARWQCQACGRWGALEVHHVVKRAQGGSDFDLDRLVALCPWCHAQTDAPYVHGRLVVMPSGAGRFIFELWEGTGKETGRVVERWESRSFPTTIEPAWRASGSACTEWPSLDQARGELMPTKRRPEAGSPRRPRQSPVG
jgi:HNH endonuclease